MVLRILVVLALLLAIDIYGFSAIRLLTKSFWPWRALWWGLSLVVAFATVYVLINLGSAHRARPSGPMMYVMGLFILVYVPKMLLLFPLMVEDLARISSAIINWTFGNDKREWVYPERRKFVSTLALGLAAIPFASILHGIWKGRYRFRVIKQELYYDDLPAAFDGFGFVQISDLHVGSFDQAEKVAYGIELINRLKPEYIFFTGDMVNNSSEELTPWKALLTKLQAEKGKFSVLGNHDYGDYVPWPSAEAKRQNLEVLKQHQAEMGFQMLHNQWHRIEKGGESIYLAGVENWGKPPFPQFGDLKKALDNIPDEAFTILLSHDPSHFDEQVKQHPKKVHLTLSGHTHGMQFGIEIPGWVKWSPVKWRYPKWAGLYEEMGKRLYVNRGFGYLAFPGRVGIWPEITYFILKKG